MMANRKVRPRVRGTKMKWYIAVTANCRRDSSIRVSFIAQLSLPWCGWSQPLTREANGVAALPRRLSVQTNDLNTVVVTSIESLCNKVRPLFHVEFIAVDLHQGTRGLQAKHATMCRSTRFCKQQKQARSSPKTNAISYRGAPPHYHVIGNSLTLPIDRFDRGASLRLAT